MANDIAALRRVARAATSAARARDARDRAVRDALARGCSLRAIAESAGLSHEQVRRLGATDA